MSTSVEVRLQAVRSTLTDADIPLFDTAVNAFVDLDSFFAQLRLLNWGISFQDEKEIAARVFCIFTDLVPLAEKTPDCAKCGRNTLFKYDKNRPFGFVYRCVDNRKMSRKEARKRETSRFICTGVIQATYNTWFENAKSISKCLGLLFCWTNSDVENFWAHRRRRPLQYIHIRRNRQQCCAPPPTTISTCSLLGGHIAQHSEKLPCSRLSMTLKNRRLDSLTVNQHKRASLQSDQWRSEKLSRGRLQRAMRAVPGDEHAQWGEMWGWVSPPEPTWQSRQCRKTYPRLAQFFCLRNDQHDFSRSATRATVHPRPVNPRVVVFRELMTLCVCVNKQYELVAANGFHLPVC